MTCASPARPGAGQSLRALVVVVASLTAVAGVLGGMLAAPARADVSPNTGPGGGTEPTQAQELLARAVHAARVLPYSGVQYIVACPGSGTTSVVVDVAHVPGQGSQIHVRETPDAPGARVWDADGEGPTSGVADLDAGALGVLARRYQLTADGQATIVGRVADLVTARRGDGSVAGRFWIDQATGLLLSREVLDRNGRLARASSFVNLAIGAKAAHLVSAPTDSVPAPWGRQVALASAGRLVHDGWHVPTELDGGSGGTMELFDIRLGHDNDGDGQVLHLSYTDGLSTLSLFEQRGHLGARGMPGWQTTRMGGVNVWTRGDAPEQVVWSGRSMVYTVLADATPEQLYSAVASLPHGAPKQHFMTRLLHRLDHGLRRLGSWLNPFD